MDAHWTQRPKQRGKQKGTHTVDRAPARAMTVVELLVVVAIIGLLAGLLMPALSSMRTSARRSAELTAARQMMAGYQTYATVNQDRVLPGYKTGLYAVDQAGVQIADTVPAGAIAAARYPWRLAPYLDYDFRGLYLNEHRDVVDHVDQGEYHYIVSLYPSLGLNTVFVGGHQIFNAWNTHWEEQYGRFYVSAIDEAEFPDRLLVFASARGTDPGDMISPVYEGYYEVQPPYYLSIGGYQWQLEEYHPNFPPGQYGYLSPRYDDEAVVAFLDGHVDTLTPDQLKDMRHWARDADAPDWGLDPLPD